MHLLSRALSTDKPEVMVGRGYVVLYVSALLSIALLSTSGFLLVSRLIQSEARSAITESINGRQLVLTQRAALLANRLVSEPSAAARAPLRQTLRETIDLFEQSHRAILGGDPSLGLARPAPEVVRQVYLAPPVSLDQQVHDFVARVQALLATPDSELAINPHLGYINTAAAGLLMEGLQKAASAYEEYTQQRAAQRAALESWIYALTLLVLLLEALFIFRPMGLQIRKAIRVLGHQANHDSLTGLVNRKRFLELLEQALPIRSGGPAFTVLFLDLNNFKMVNDSLGHPAGDELLMEAARRLEQTLASDSVVARFGGDEFALLCYGVHSPNAASALAEGLLEAVHIPFTLRGQQLRLGVSIGVVMVENQYHSSINIIRDADTAMYQAKERGISAYQFFDAALRLGAVHRLQIATDLHQAIAKNQLEIYYQPIIHAASGSVSGFECLLRWIHPELGFIPPLEFIPIAEEIGLIVEIDRWVLVEAAKQMQHWNTSYKASWEIGINLSGRQLVHNDFAGWLRQTLTRLELPSSNLILELTENVMVDDTAEVQAQLEQLHSLGIRLFLDDFGTGFSSLKYLRRFRPDGLKIDRSFVQQMSSPEGAQMIRDLINLAHGQGIPVVVEGVETQEQYQILEALGCDYLQGYLFARPMNQEQLEAYLNSLEPNLRDLELE